MPVESCSNNGKPGFKWGESGHCYVYNPKNSSSMRNAKKNAIRQGLAIGGGTLEKKEEMINGYPAATQDVKINIRNRQDAIDIANYGPINPLIDNSEYWQKKADLFNTTVDDAKSARCANCAAFVQTKEIIDAIANGLGGEPMAYSIAKLANLGYCDIFEFKCAGLRTCDAWIAGGPVINIQGETNE